ncbi:MAG: type II toxin-antitoxin system RelE/ParE family toxin [Bacteroidales bacterium]|nr:type II toxin-antitoxin system RelE/ParE family toxin [Bacteroidales bacterium]
MKIIWSDFASQNLLDIYQYHKESVGKNIAQKIKTKIFKSTRQLVKHPNSGPIEKSLERLGEDHRYLVSGNYKVVYKIINEGTLITDIFDTRQDPLKLDNPKKKHSR